MGMRIDLTSGNTHACISFLCSIQKEVTRLSADSCDGAAVASILGGLVSRHHS